MNAKEVRKGIEEHELRENATGWSILQILFVSAASMVPFGHWIGSIIVLIALITLFSIKKIRLIANIVLTLATSIFVAGFCFVGLGLITAIVGFLISIIFFGIKNVLNYMHNVED